MITIEMLQEINKCDRFNFSPVGYLSPNMGIRSDAFFRTVEGDCSKVFNISIKQLIALAIIGQKQVEKDL